MEKMTFIGAKYLDFNADGEQVKGVKVFLSAEPMSADVVGKEVVSYFYKPDSPIYAQPRKWKPGCALEVEFGRGKAPLSFKEA